MAGLTYEELLAKQSQAAPVPDEDSFEQGFTFEELQQRAKRAPKDPGFEMSGLGDITRKYLKGVNPDIMEEWYNRSASRSLGGWVTEKLISALPGGKEAVANIQRPKQEAPTDTSILEDVQAALGHMISNPKETAIEMGKHFLANPELIGFGALSGARGGKRLADMAKLGRAGRAAGAAAGSAFEGAVGMGAQEAALQLKYEDVDWKKVGSSATAGAIINPIFQGSISAAGHLMRRKPGEAPPVAEELPPEPPGPINFERKLTTAEAGVKTKSGKIKREGTPYESLRGEPSSAASSPLAREVIYGNEFGKFPEGDNFTFDTPEPQPSIDVAPFKAETLSNPLSQRIRAERQALVDSGFRTKEMEVDQAWKEYKAGQLRENEIDARRQELADVEDRLMQKVDNQKGSITTDQLVTIAALSGATAAGLYAYTHPDQQKELATAAAALGGVLATKGKMDGLPKSALGPMLAGGKYTLKTLDRLPQNQTEFHPAQVRQELNKPGTPAAEKTALEGTIAQAEAEGRKVTAQELVSDFRMKTGDHTLTPKRTDQFADYGYDNIRSTEEAQLKTIIWQFPEHMEVATTNHFGDPRYYGHTREFRENGVDHVMEIQSDLAQGVRKPLTSEQRIAIQEELATLEVRPKAPRPDLTREQKLRWQELSMSLLRDKTTQATLGRQGPDSSIVKALTQKIDAAKAEIAAITEKITNILDDFDDNGGIFPIAEYSELRSRRKSLDLSVTELRKELEDAIKVTGYAPLTPALKNAENRLIREKLAEAAAKGDESVRFASADTVAKVEGWDGHSPADIPSIRKRIKYLEDGMLAYRNHPELRETVLKELETYKQILPQLEAGKSIFNQPGHQSLYDRYAKETTSYLKKLGGKEITDAEGHTWWEVPTNIGVGKTEISRPFGGRTDASGQGPIEMYGHADPRLLAAIAATGLATATYLALPDEQKEGVKNYLQAVGALAAVGTVGKAGPHSTGKLPTGRAGKIAAMVTGAAVGGYLAGDETLAGAVIGGIVGLAATRLPTLGRSIGKVLSPQDAFGTAVRISAALGAGYYLGGKVDHPIEGAAVASALLLGRKFLKPAMAREGDALINIRNGNLAAWDTLRHNIVRDINKLVPDAARREAISEAIQVGARNHLAPAEREVYDFINQMNARIGNDAVDAKVLRSLRQNYITSIVELETTITPSARQALIDKILGKAFPENLGPNTRFARQRKYDTFAELNQALEGSGLKLKTKDVGEIFDIYAKSMRKAIEDRVLLDSLKAAKGTDDLPYVAKRDKYGRFPAGFRRINHPQLENMAVHPEVYDSLKVVMENDNPDIITAGLYGASMAVKRMQVFGSLFHAKSLGEVYLLAMGTDILPRVGDWKRPKTVIDAARKKFHEMKLGDEIDGLTRAGLKLEVPDDVKTSIIGDLGRLVDTTTGTRIAGKAADKVDYVNKWLDHATWDYMHAGVKSAVALDAVAKFTRNNAELHAKDPARYPLKSKQEIYVEAARFANDATGGLDWFRIATEAKTELGRSVALQFASPQGRRVAQILAFAPDWALSTLRAGFNVFGKSETGFRGLLKPTNAVDLYRQYALRSAALWITLINGIQYAVTGKPIWENKDPTRIEFTDGTSIQPGKHSAEAVHAVMDPVKFAMNKLGYLPSLAADIAAYRHGSGFMAMSPHSPVTYAALKAAPFTASPLAQPHLSVEERVGRSISGGLGFPVHGMTQEQKLLARSERLRRAAEKGSK